MQLQIKLGDATHILTAPDSFSDGQAFQVKLGALSYTLRWHRLLETFFLMNSEGVEEPLRVRSFGVRTFADDPESVVVAELGMAGSGRLHCIETSVQRYLPGQEARAKSGEKKSQVLRSQITGKVLKILVSEGQDIKANEALVIIEAMKMENRVFARISGKVTGIKIKEGAAVTTGDELMRIG